MKTRLIAATVLSLGFLSAGAFAGQAGDEVDNHIADYGAKTEMIAKTSTKAIAAHPILKKKRGYVAIGDFIDETMQESHQRSSTRNSFQ
jgi:outer membrane lipoprotein-sorting protein